MRPARILGWLLPFSLVLAGANGCGTAGAPAADEGDPTPAARLNGEEISIGSVDAWIKEELFRQASEDGDEVKLHELRSQAVGNMINERLVEAEAKVRGMTSDEMMQAEAEERMKVADTEVRQFFEANQGSMGGLDFEAAAPQIRAHLERTKGPQAARAFVDELREGSEGEVLLVRPRVEVAATGVSKGPDDAPVTIVEFSDYQCPYCSRAGPIIAEVLKRYEGKVRFVYRHFPLDRIHPQARGASEAALCANDQGKFWEFHAALFEPGADMQPTGLTAIAEKLELDMDAYGACTSERRYQAQVETDLADGREAGVTGTPAFFVNGIVLKGAQPVEEFSRIIDEELGAG